MMREHDADCALPANHHGSCGDDTRIYRAPAGSGVTWITIPTDPLHSSVERALTRDEYVQAVMGDRCVPREDP